MTRRSAILLAILTLVAAQLGVPVVSLAAAPVASGDDGVVIQKNASATPIDVLANDTVDPEATITAVSDPTHGTAAIAGDGLGVTYTPDTDYTGLDTFTYTVTDPDLADGADTALVSVRVNAPPLAFDDPAVPGCNPAATPPAFGGSFPIPEDWGQFVLGYECGPSANDSDPDGTIASWQVDTPPAHGSLEWDKGVPGFVGYTPDANYSTPEGDWLSDSFTYHVVDNNGASSNEATYRIWVSPINDPPTVTAGAFNIQSPEDIPYSQPWATDISKGPANESDQTVHFELHQWLLGNNPNLFSEGPAIAPDGTLTFTPAPNQTGYIRLSFVAKDDGGLVNPVPYGQQPPPDDTSDPVVVDITITPVNDAPVATTDVATVTEDQPSASIIGVLGNDSDAESDSLTVTATTNGAKGVAAMGAGGTSVTYKPNANAYGSDTFTYTVSDGNGGSSIGTVNVTITPVNDPPNAINDGNTTVPLRVWLNAGPQAIPVLANDTWLPDAPETLLITAVTQGGHGTVAITGGGTALTYNPIGTATTTDFFTYSITDGHGGTDTASVYVKPAADTTAPVATIVSIQKSTIPGRSGLRIYVKWAISESGSGLKSQLFQRRTDSGSWVTVTLSSLTTRSVSLALGRGHTYTFRVRATDRAGNVGAFASRQIRI